MKKNIAYLFILTLLISCKSNIKDIKLTSIENDKKWDYYYIDSKNSADYQSPIDTFFVCKPISFRLKNNTGKDLQTSAIVNYTRAGVIVNNKDFVDGISAIKINSTKSIDITIFLHLPISISSIDKEYKEKLTIVKNRIINDSIVLDKISPRMQDAIDTSFKKEHITMFLFNKNNQKEEVWLSYCVYKQKTFVFDSDSLSKANPRFKPDCN